jgi:hypothetical protein
MLCRVSARELAEWEIFYQIEAEERAAEEAAAAQWNRTP